MPVKNGDGGVEKLCGESRFSLAVHVVAACFYLLYSAFGMTPKARVGHHVASGGCDPKKK